MKIQKKIDVYLVKKKNTRIIDLVQYDTGIQLIFCIKDFEIPEGTSATLYAQKPSGKFVYQESGITISGNDITVNLENQAITEHEKVWYQVSLKNGTDEITTFTGLMMVQKSLKDAGAAESEIVIRAFEELTAEKIEEIKAESATQLGLIEGKFDALADTKADKNDVANAIKGNLSGSVVVADDVSPIEHNPVVKVHGKNLSPYGTITFTRNKSYLLENPLPAGTYTISAYITSDDTDGIYSAVSINHKSEVMKYIALKRDSRVSYTFTVDKPITNIDFCAAYNYSQGEGDSATWADIQIEEGETATPYEAYIDPTTVNVRRCGKNLIPYPYSESNITRSGITYSVNDKGIITANGTSSGSYFNVITTASKRLYFRAGVTYHLSGVPKKTGLYYAYAKDASGTNFFDYGEGASFIPKESGYGAITIVISADSTVSNVVFTPQIEIGSEETGFEIPYEYASYTPSSDGTVSGMTSLSPNMTILSDTDGVIIECEYNKDTKKYVDKNILNGTVISENADFAEVGEWSDGNPNNEDRIGYFVSVDTREPGKTMVKATSTSDVRGVTMFHPAFSGNASAEKYDAEGNLLTQYDYVGFAGFVPVIDNGTCTVNGRCMPANDGTAIPSINNLGYQVIERIDDTHVLILVEPQADMMVRIKEEIELLKKHGGVTDEQISNAVNEYLSENPVSGLDASKAEENQVPVSDGNGNWSWGYGVSDGTVTDEQVAQAVSSYMIENPAPKGDKGDPGEYGKSAYEIALENGFSGTETEWIESLKGEKGDPGNDGSDASVTAENIEAALGYNPAKENDVNNLKEDIPIKATMIGKVLNFYNNDDKKLFSVDLSSVSGSETKNNVYITTHPQSVTINVGSEGLLSVTATADGTLSYQWYISWDNGNSYSVLDGYTESTLQISFGQAGKVYYKCLITSKLEGADDATAWTDPAYIEWIEEPSEEPSAGVSIQVSGYTSYSGNVYVFSENSNFVISALAENIDSPSYQWYRSLNGGANWEAVSGWTEQSYTRTISSTNLWNNCLFKVNVTSGENVYESEIVKVTVDDTGGSGSEETDGSDVDVTNVTQWEPVAINTSYGIGLGIDGTDKSLSTAGKKLGASTTIDDSVTVSAGEILKFTSGDWESGWGTTSYAQIVFLDNSNTVIEANCYGKVTDKLITVPDGAAKMRVMTYRNNTKLYKKVTGKTDEQKNAHLAEMQARQTHELASNSNRVTFKSFAKPYITFIADDIQSTFDDIWSVFQTAGVPLCVAPVTGNLQMPSYDSTIEKTYRNIIDDLVSAGGEVLAHHGNPITSSDIDDYDTLYEHFVHQKQCLINYGYNVQGCILSGGSGQIMGDTRTDLWMREYFKYSDAYGLQAYGDPYYHIRVPLSEQGGLEGCKSVVDNAASNNEWVVFFLHNTGEFSADNLTELINYIKSKGITIATYAAVYDAQNVPASNPYSS